ncbi:MAG: alpha/beta hydrolase [Candidatus Eremiobacteraeota bacterium]|nr:alpha/beta hydrolase [Candidatus Eremiobacteraeota bacterium]
MRKWTPLFLCLLFLFPAAADDELKVPQNFASLWVDETAVVTPEAVNETVAALKKQQAQPQHVIVMIHGFDVDRNYSTTQFDALAERLGKQFAPTDKVAYAGVQWDSANDKSVFQMDKVYWEKISVARSTGRGPTRDLLAAIRKEFPNTHISILAHSMGCEVLAAAIVPEIKYDDQVPFVETAHPDKKLPLLMAVMCGSDLDFDIWAKSHVAPDSKEKRSKMTWSTVVPYDGRKDKVLSVRGGVRGRAAGTSFPKMTLEQLDDVVSTRHMMLDNKDIPEDHAFEKYYNEARLARIVPVMKYLSNPKTEKPEEIAELDKVLAAPGSYEALQPFLDSGRYGPLFYALWRLERVNCKDARHLCDGTLEKVGRMLKDQPKMVWKEQGTTECVSVKSEQFPTEKMMTRAGAPPWAKKKSHY